MATSSVWTDIVGVTPSITVKRALSSSVKLPPSLFCNQVLVKAPQSRKVFRVGSKLQAVIVVVYSESKVWISVSETVHVD